MQLVFCQKKKICGLLVLKQSKRRVHPLLKKILDPPLCESSTCPQVKLEFQCLFSLESWIFYHTLKTFFFPDREQKRHNFNGEKKNKQTQEKTKQNKTFDNNCPQSKAKTNNVSLGSEEKLSLLTLLIYKKPSQI